MLAHLNENCADMQLHPGEFPKFRTKILETSALIAAGLGQLKAGRVCGMLLKCIKCSVAVTFTPISVGRSCRRRTSRPRASPSST